MGKQKGFVCIGVLLLLFVVASIFTFHRSKTLIEQGYFAAEGVNAKNFAALVSANISLTDKQVDTLKGYTYNELLNSTENKALRSMMDNDSFSQKVAYAYIMVHLRDNEVKYSVTADNGNRFDAPVGTPLDIMWLLDVNVTEDEEKQALEADEWKRYSYYIEKDASIFGRTPTYLFNSSEWGDHICGYAPFYSAEGRYVGVVGIELQTNDYDAYCGQAVLALGIVMAVSLVMLSVLFAYIYFRYRRLQFDKIYVDSLVRIYNRSYYNNQFIKRMNISRSDRKFALMIADVDWFKAVNDTFGHEIGDQALIELGEILVDIFGKQHVVRFGGEEFVAGLWIDNEAELLKTLDSLYTRVDSHRFSSQEITLSISLGCSFYETQELNGWLMSGMLRAADCKLYEAKSLGRKCYLVEQYDATKEYRKDPSDPGDSPRR